MFVIVDVSVLLFTVLVIVDAVCDVMVVVVVDPPPPPPPPPPPVWLDEVDVLVPMLMLMVPVCWATSDGIDSPEDMMERTAVNNKIANRKREDFKSVGPTFL